jgi:flagellar basal body-associated protein FliL
MQNNETKQSNLKKVIITLVIIVVIVGVVIGGMIFLATLLSGIHTPRAH